MRWLPLLFLALLLPLPLPAEETPPGELLYSRKEGDRYFLHTLRPDGTGDHLLPGQTAVVNFSPAWSPDGKRIAFQAAADAKGQMFQVCLLNRDGTGALTLDGPNNNQWNGRPCWSPDGKQLVFSSGQAQPGIYLRDMTTGDTRHVPNTGVACALPFWKPDGTAVGYTNPGADGRQAELVFTKTDGSETTLILKAERTVVAGAHALSPDGKQLLYFIEDFDSRTTRLHIWEFENKSDTTLLEAGPLDYDEVPHVPAAAWSPDGKWLLVSVPSEKGWGLFRVSPDGKQKTRLTPEGVDCVGAAWRA